MAYQHFDERLHVETDPVDVHADLQKGVQAFLLIDARAEAAFRQAHLPGALNFPYRNISEETAASLPREKLLVTYCWGPSCNASTKAAARLSQLGFRVKAMIGGIEYWQREGRPLVSEESP